MIFSCLQELYRCKQLYLEQRLEACRQEAAERAQQEGKVFEKRKEKKKTFTSSMMSGMKSLFDEDKDKDHNKKDKEEGDGKETRKEDDAVDLGLDLIDRRLAIRPSDVEDFSLLDFKHADNLVQDVVLLGLPASTNVSH